MFVHSRLSTNISYVSVIKLYNLDFCPLPKFWGPCPKTWVEEIPVSFEATVWTVFFSILLDPEIFCLGTFIQKPSQWHPKERDQESAQLWADAVYDHVPLILNSSPGEWQSVGGSASWERKSVLDRLPRTSRSDHEIQTLPPLLNSLYYLMPPTLVSPLCIVWWSGGPDQVAGLSRNGLQRRASCLLGEAMWVHNGRNTDIGAKRPKF